VTDALEEQGMEKVIARLVNREGTDPDLEEQLRIYDLVLQHEDEEAHSAALSGTVDNIRFVCWFDISKIIHEFRHLHDKMQAEMN